MYTNKVNYITMTGWMSKQSVTRLPPIWKKLAVIILQQDEKNISQNFTTLSYKCVSHRTQFKHEFHFTLIITIAE